MNKTPRLSKSGIEYLDCAWNFYSGCNNKEMGICQVQNCWAEDITRRMIHNYPNGFKPTFYPEAFLSPLQLKKPSRIGVAFMGDLFGDWIKPGKMINVPMVPGLSHAEPLKEQVYRTINQCPQHTFLFKTKCPWNLIKWSPFPDNCWVGVSATDHNMLQRATGFLRKVEAKVKYVSLEPLLRWQLLNEKWMIEDWEVAGLSWVIIGAQTKPYKPPEIEWVQEIVEACDKAGTPVFLKDNLAPLLASHNWKGKPSQNLINAHKAMLRQEMPCIRGISK